MCFVQTGTGGLIGYVNSSSDTSSVVRNSYALGPVASSNAPVTGGLVGNTQMMMPIIHSYARGPGLFQKQRRRHSDWDYSLLPQASRTYMARAPLSQGAAQPAASLAERVRSAGANTYSGRNLYVDSAGSANGGIGNLTSRPPATRLPGRQLRPSNGCADPCPPP